MGITEHEKNTLHNLFNKVGLEGSSKDEIKYYIKNIYLYKEPKEIIEKKTEALDELDDINDYCLPKKLAFQRTLNNNKIIAIINSIGEKTVNDYKNDNYQEKTTQDNILKDKLNFNLSNSKENIYNIFSKIGKIK